MAGYDHVLLTRMRTMSEVIEQLLRSELSVDRCWSELHKNNALVLRGD
jgi:hypothetical protein